MSLKTQRSVCFVVRVLQQTVGSHEQLLQTAQAPLPVCRCMLLEDQVKQASEMQEEQKDTGSHDIINLRPVSSEPSRPLSDHPFLQQSDACSLPSSPCPGWWKRRKLPCSLPCSPLLGGQPYRALTTSLSPPPNLSRMWVEAALQRSKNTRHGKPRDLSSGPSQVRQGWEEEQRSRWRNREEEEEQEWSDEEQEEDDKGNTFGIRLSDTVIFRPMTLTCVSGKGRSQEEEEEEEVLCLDPDMWRYCLLTPCICLRYTDFLNTAPILPMNVFLEFS